LHIQSFLFTSFFDTQTQKLYELFMQEKNMSLLRCNSDCLTIQIFLFMLFQLFLLWQLYFLSVYLPHRSVTCGLNFGSVIMAFRALFYTYFGKGIWDWVGWVGFWGVSGLKFEFSLKV